ncbi:lysozyme [Gordonia sp. CPCC 206044]|uniref:LGFP repeat-containing protein n=1 Tax=Gordonia sp. CPCC 206044 TaxID=3140793 RepID=UPI003AF3E076
MSRPHTSQSPNPAVNARSRGRFGVRRRVIATSLVCAMSAIGVLGVAHSASPARADVKIGGHSVGGKIGNAYILSGGVVKWGKPTGPERAAAKGGRVQHFSRDASFYWHPSIGDGAAHEVGGAIAKRWRASGAERGPLGYPTTSEIGVGSGRLNNFQGGVICFSDAGGVQVVRGGILKKWQAQRGAGGYYGVPLGGMYKVGSRYAQDFLNGTIFWP